MRMVPISIFFNLSPYILYRGDDLFLDIRKANTLGLLFNNQYHIKAGRDVLINFSGGFPKFTLYGISVRRFGGDFFTYDHTDSSTLGVVWHPV
jgi:hypothetical protein